MDARRLFFSEFMAGYHDFSDVNRVINKEELKIDNRMRIRFLNRKREPCGLAHAEIVEVFGRGRLMRAWLGHYDIDVNFFRPVLSSVPTAHIRVLKSYSDRKAISSLRVLFERWLK